MANKIAGPLEFWRKVNKTGICWLWEGATDKQGYGIVRRTMLMKYMVRAHRYSWFITHGRMPLLNEFVCHKCDTPLCVRPDHLFLGSHQDNMDDMVKKKRQTLGERNYQAKLTEKQIKQIRGLLEIGLEQQTIATLLFVSQTNISMIKLGKTWRHV